MSLSFKKLAIILPTFNESKNLRFLLNKINKILPYAHIFIVDDSNPVENKKIRKIVNGYKNVQIFTREKKMGRGSAVLYGFEQALKNKRLEFFVEMDTDLAHKPEELPLFQEAMKKHGAQLVIGSRYLEKSKIIDWPLRRLVLSKIINFCLNFWLGIKLHDYTNGYRLYQRKAVEYLVKTGIKEKNFIALSESAFLLKNKKFIIVEVPISFTDRKHGESSVGAKELWFSLVGALRIKLRYNLELNQKKPWFPLSKVQALVMLVIIATFLRFWNINAMGKTWDESAYVEQGYYMVESIRKGDLTNKQLYHSDHPPFSRYVYGVAEQVQVGVGHKQSESFPYDYTYPRIVSLLFSVLSVILVFFIGWQYVSHFVGFAAGLILAMLPFFLGFSQLATLESLIMFFFTASVYGFLKFLNTNVKKWILFTGIISGLSLLVKQSNVLIFPLLLCLDFVHSLHKKSNFKKIILFNQSFWIPLVVRSISIVLLSAITFIALWPFILFHMHDVLSVQNTMWVKNVSLPPPEVFFGRLMLVPFPYYLVFFLITTPIAILVLFFLGFFRIYRLNRWIFFAIIIWFLFPFLQSFYTFKQHGIRYIIQIYAPMAIIAAVGFEMLIHSLSTKKIVKIMSIFILFFYMLVILSKANPYYLDYFNGFVGGTNGVYEKRLFQLGWWGQGLKEAGTYIENHAEKGETIGLAAKPFFSFPLLKDHPTEFYTDKKEYNYVVVSYFLILREGFEDKEIKEKYSPVYSVLADRAPIVIVYKKK